MNIGFVTYFAFRPHVEHVYALSKIIEHEGHNVFFLSCDSALSDCYRRELTNSHWSKECMKCTVGGLRSYVTSNIDSAHKFKVSNAVPTEQWGHSSACTILRAETEEDKSSKEFIDLKAKLSKSAYESFMISKGWMKAKKLDAVVCFNGRMDATRGVLEAAKSEKIRFVSVERAWSDGLLLLPDSDCLGLIDVHLVVSAFGNKALLTDQAFRAAKIVASRFLKKNKTEWRTYNLNSVNMDWPIPSAQKKVLLLPSSYNEYDGHPEWKMKWKNQFDAFENIIKDLGFPLECFIMRGHPNWSENIGAAHGDKIEVYYREWAESMGILYIPGKSNISTKNLIEQADIIILNGGSAAIEAGLLGKNIISLIETTYKTAGFVINYLSPEDRPKLLELSKTNSTKIIRLTLRYLYSWGFRLMQYTKEIEAIDSINYRYRAELNGAKLMKIIQTGRVHPDDSTFSDNENAENEVIELIKQGDWESIYAHSDPKNTAQKYIEFPRRFGFRFIDKLRAMFPSGDR